MRKTLEKYGKDSLPLDDIIPVLPSLLINARGPKVTKPTLKLIEVILKISDTDYTPQLMKHAPTIPAVQLEKMKKLFETHGKVSYQTEYWNQFEASKVAPKLEKPKPWTESIDGSLGDGYLNAAVNDCFKILESAEKIGPTTREKLTTAIAGVFRTPRSPTIIASCAKLVIKLAEILPVGEFDNAKEIAKQLYEQFKIRMKTADEVLAEALMKLITVKHIKPKDIDSDSIALKATMKNKYKALKSPKTVLELEVKLEGKKKKKKVSTVDEKSSKKKSSGTSKSRSSKKKKDSETSEKVGKSSSKKSSKSKSSAEKTEKVSKSRSSKSSSEKVSKSKSSKSTAEKTDKVSKSKSRSDKKKSSSGDSEKKKSSSGDADKPPKTPKKKSSKSTADSDVVTSRPKTPKSSNKSKTSDSDTGISQLKTPKTPKKKSSKSSAESDIGASRPKTPKSSSKSKSSKSLKKAKSKKSEH